MKTTFISIVAAFGIIANSVAAPTPQDDLITDEMSDALGNLGIVSGVVRKDDEEQW